MASEGRSEATRELTPEGRSEATRELTPEGRSEATRELTPEGRSEATRELTPEGRSEATRELTPEGRSEATRETTPEGRSEATRETTPRGPASADPAQKHRGGGFNPPKPTTRGGPDYARFVEAVRTIGDHARAVDAHDEVIAEAADLLENVSALLAPYDADEWTSPSGRRMDLPDRGNVLNVPSSLRKTADGRIRGTARFRRFHLGRNGAAHGGTVAMLFDAVLGFTAAHLTGSMYQRTAFLHVNYHNITPIEKELQIDAGVDKVEGRKIFVEGRLTEGERLLADARALFVRLRPGQP